MALVSIVGSSLFYKVRYSPVETKWVFLDKAFYEDGTPNISDSIIIGQTEVCLCLGTFTYSHPETKNIVEKWLVVLFKEQPVVVADFLAE